MSLSINPATIDNLCRGTSLYLDLNIEDSETTWAAGPNVADENDTGPSVYTSTDGGNTWADSSTGITHANVHVIIRDPVDSTIMYVGTNGDGIFISADSGNTWTSSNTGLTSLDIQSLAINLITPTILYAGSITGGVFKSTNSGVNWTAVNTGLTDLRVRSLAVNPLTPTILYAGTEGDGIFKSTNSGGSWTATNTGLTDLGIYVITIDPSNGSTIYIATPNDFTDGLFKSTDSGATWVVSDTGLPTTNVKQIAIDPDTPSIIYALTAVGFSGGVYKSTNSGALWTVSNTGMTSTSNVAGLAINPFNTSTLFAGTGNYIDRSSDSGDTWEQVNTGLGTRDYLSFIFAAGGAPAVLPLVWTVSSGEMPEIWTLDADTGVITGVATEAGDFSFTIRVTDAVDDFGEISFSFTVYNSPTIQTLFLPSGCVTKPYSAEILFTGGTAPYVYTYSAYLLDPGGAIIPIVPDIILPPGLTLDGNYGVLKGIPTQEGDYNFFITVTDSFGCKSSRSYTIHIYGFPTFYTLTLPPACENNNYSMFIEILNGFPPYYWFITSIETLPTGLSLNVYTGEISGVATVPGIYTFTVTVKDQNDLNVFNEFTLIVNAEDECVDVTGIPGVSVITKARLMSTLSAPVVVRDPFHQTHMNDYLPEPFIPDDN